MSVAMRKFPVVLIKVPTPLRAGLVVSFPGVVGLDGDGDSANCHQLHPPWHPLSKSGEVAYEHYFGVSPGRELPRGR